MKITIYALHLGFGGVEKYVITLANILSTAHDVKIVSTYKMTNEPAFYLNKNVKVEYLIENMKPNKEKIHEFFTKKHYIKLVRECYYSLKILFYKRYLNIKSIKECSSDIIISTRIFHNNLISRYANTNIVKITGEHNHHNNDTKYIDDVINSCKKFDYFIPISKELCEFYEKAMLDNGVKTKYIRFCIDENKNFKQPNFNNKNIITVARLSVEKGIYDLIELFTRVHNKMPGVILNIIGDGPEYEKIQGMIKDKDLEGYVVLHGFQNKEYIYNLMSKSYLYIMTSYTESFGIVLLEAMSCKIPCLAYSSAQGAHEIIKNGYNGYLIEDRNISKMENMVYDLLNDKNKILELSENAYCTAEKFSYSNTKKAWLAFMDSIEKEKNND